FSKPRNRAVIRGRNRETLQNPSKRRTFSGMGEDQTLYLSTGRAAKVLGLSADAVRRLCHAGLIEGAVQTPGGQWRIPTGEIDRMLEEGTPMVPAPLPAQRRASRTDDDDERDEDSQAQDNDIGLLADPSDAAIQAADEVVRLRSEVEALRLKR